MNDALVTIVMPVYNAADYLEESLGDLVKQSYSNIEIICVNDGSSDNSGAVLESFAGRDERMIVISQENRGGGAARNRGYDEANGDYIIFLDADDRFESTLIEKAVTKAASEKCDVLMFAADEFHYVTGTRRPAPWLMQSRGGSYDGNPFHYTTTTVWNKLFRRDYLVKNKVRFMDERVVADTMYFTFFALMYAKKISFIDEVLLHYRSDNPQSLTRKHDKRPLDILKVLGTIWDRLRADKELSSRQDIYVNFALKYLFERTSWFQSIESFSQVYDALHSGGFEKIGLTDDKDQFIEGDNWRNIKRSIVDNELTEYLFLKEKQYKDKGLLTKTVYFLPGQIYQKLKEADCKVALYGGGMVGKSYFPQIQSISTAKVVAWVDARFDTIGYPLQSPEILGNISFDYIVICSEHSGYLSEIKSKLNTMGIPNEKILWEMPEKQI